MPRAGAPGHFIHSHGVHGAGFHLPFPGCSRMTRDTVLRRRLTSVRKNVSSGRRSDRAQENRLCGVLNIISGPRANDPRPPRVAP